MVCLTVIDDEGANDSICKEVDVRTPETSLGLTVAGGLGLSITTQNIGQHPAINVTTQIALTGGLFKHINITTEVSCAFSLPPDETLTGKVYPIGVGPISVEVTVVAQNAAPVSKIAKGIVLLFFVILP